MSEINIRVGKIDDIPHAYELVRELAVYEKAPEAVMTSVESMKRDGFGPNPLFEFFVAEVSGTIVGMSLYYYRYSTWKGKRLFLEDIIVTESFRGKGVGKELLDVTIQKAQDENCTGIMWQVLDWNESAISFYKKYDVDLDGEWLNCNLDFN